MTQANNVGQLTPQVNSSGVLQVAGGGTGLSAVGTSGYVLASNGSANVYVSAVGYSGYSGYSGTNGSNGTSGFSGYSGTNGSNGTSGFSGYSGTNGSNGATGTSGYSGTNGSAGSTGTSGYSGYSGATGAGASTSFNAVGSYCSIYVGEVGVDRSWTGGANYSAGGGGGQVQAGLVCGDNCNLGTRNNNQLSGTWKWMSMTLSINLKLVAIGVRVA